MKCSEFSFGVDGTSVTCSFESQVFDLGKEGQITRVWLLTDVETHAAGAGSGCWEWIMEMNSSWLPPQWHHFLEADHIAMGSSRICAASAKFSRRYLISSTFILRDVDQKTFELLRIKKFCGKVTP